MGVSGSRRYSAFDNPAESAVDYDDDNLVASRSLPPPRPPPSSSSSTSASCLLKPPKESCLILKKLIDVTWERILPLLSTGDLLSFMLSCKEARDVTLNFIAHFVSSDGRMRRLKEILYTMREEDEEDEEDSITRTMPLMQHEKALGLKMRRQRKRGVDRPTLLHYKAVCIFSKSRDCLRRENVFNAELFPHLGNSSYIVRTFDRQLKRDVVRLESVCWLQFAKTFDDVGPGCYEMSLRMRLTRHFHWPASDANHSTYIVVSRKDDSGRRWTELVSLAVDSDCRNSIYRRKFREKSLPNATIRFDGQKEGSWFWIILEPFRLEKRSSSVRFEFRDVENPWWKSGMEWDFIQMQRLDSANSGCRYARWNNFSIQFAEYWLAQFYIRNIFLSDPF